MLSAIKLKRYLFIYIDSRLFVCQNLVSAFSYFIIISPYVWLANIQVYNIVNKLRYSIVQPIFKNRAFLAFILCLYNSYYYNWSFETHFSIEYYYILSSITFATFFLSKELFQFSLFAIYTLQTSINSTNIAFTKFFQIFFVKI